ncbi:MAG: hypothetical protein ICV54_01885 [Nostoc sp. C3-bin3]|nr:hypothetical protein [Nostoc sp. C3-bin3]
MTICSMRGANAMQVLEQSVVVFSQIRTLFKAGMQLRIKPKALIHPAISFAEQFWIDMQGSLE